MAEESPNDKLGHKIKILKNEYSRALNSSLVEWDLTESQSLILAYLDHFSGLPCQHDIETKFNIKHPTATGILKRLAEKEYVTFVSDEDDKRLKRILITDSGRAVSQSTKSRLDNVENILTSALTDDELRTLNLLLDKLVTQTQKKLKQKG